MQSDEDFIFCCFDSPSLQQQKVSLSVRRAIAKLGKTSAELIQATASFEQLDSLPFWRSCGDAGFETRIFITAIEVELGCQFTEAQLSNAPVRDPDLNAQMKIYEFIQEFSDWYISCPKYS